MSLTRLFTKKKAKLADNIVIYGITVLTKKALLQIPLKKNTSILLNIDIPCSPTVEQHSLTFLLASRIRIVSWRFFHLNNVYCCACSAMTQCGTFLCACARGIVADDRLACIVLHCIYCLVVMLTNTPAPPSRCGK